MMKNKRKKCPRCGKNMKQQFIGLFHCQCGISWRIGSGYFERTPDMVFALKHSRQRKGPPRLTEIRFK